MRLRGFADACPRSHRFTQSPIRLFTDPRILALSDALNHSSTYSLIGDGRRGEARKQRPSGETAIGIPIAYPAVIRPIVAGKLTYYVDSKFRAIRPSMKDETMTNSQAPEWPDPADKAHAVEQAKRLRDQAAKGGLRFEAYLPPALALWLLERIEQGNFLDPSEAVFVILGEHEELEPHADLRQKLFERGIQAAIDDPQPAIPHKEVMAEMREMLKQPRPEPARWEKQSRR